MSDAETTESMGGSPFNGAAAPRIVPFPGARSPTSPSAGASPGQTQVPPQVAFDREELRDILNVYGRKVAAGEWRDYAIDFTRDRAVFAVFQRTADVPLFRIEKDPKLARRQGAYSVIGANGRVLKRGHELPRVLQVFEKPLRVVD